MTVHSLSAPVHFDSARVHVYTFPIPSNPIQSAGFDRLHPILHHAIPVDPIVLSACDIDELYRLEIARNPISPPPPHPQDQDRRRSIVNAD